MENVLYHYCSVESFFSILQNSTIWLSDVAKSNDYQECILCRNRVNEAIEEIMSEDEQYLNAWRTWSELGLVGNGGLHTYCACFSENCDQLSQWRGYANNGKGISIGFSKEVLSELEKASEYHVAFAPVIYDATEQEGYIKDIVEDNLKKLERKGIGHVALELGINYRMKFPFVKNASFWEEGEWRIVVCSKPGYNVPRTENFVFSQAKYRVSNEKLVSYTEMNFSKIKKELIKEIWIGPKSEVEIDDVLCFLQNCGYYEGVAYNEKEPIIIRKSASSYR